MSPCRLARLGALAVMPLFAVLEARPLNAQPPSARRPTALLLRRVAEACDGTPIAGPVWIVVGSNAPNAVLRVFADSAEAAALRAQLGADSVSVLPCVSPIEVGRPRPLPPVLLSGCIHDRLSNMRGAMCPPEQMFHLRDIRAVSLVVRTSDSTYTVSLDGADAVFLSLSALDKFAFPYYTRILGAEATAAIRREVVGNISRVP